jgi:hypothetical protein
MPVIVGCTTVRSNGQQRLYNRQMTLHAGQVQRRVAVTILRLNVSSSTLALVEDTRSCTMAIVVGVNIHSMATQLDDNGQMSVGAGEVQRRPAVKILGFHVSSMLHQLVENLYVALEAGLVQRRLGAIIMHGVYVSSKTQKPTDLWHVVLRYRLEQFSVNAISVNPIRSIHSFFRSSNCGSVASALSLEQA